MTKHMGDAEIPVNLIPLKSSLDNYYLVFVKKGFNYICYTKD